jgi:hypothetical protein
MIYPIDTWAQFFDAVEAMRVCQKEYSRTNSPVARSAAERHEVRIDECIERKRKEWAARKQPELTGGKRNG